jgi:hypothetical protein
VGGLMTVLGQRLHHQASQVGIILHQ